MDFDIPESYTIELLTTTIDASHIKATITDGMAATLFLAFGIFSIPILVMSLKEAENFHRLPEPKEPEKSEESEESTAKLVKDALPSILMLILIFGSFPILGIYSLIASHNSYGNIPGYSITTNPQSDSTDPQKQTVTTLLHDEITTKLEENAEAFNKYGLKDRCTMINELTGDHPESILCGGTQLISVETDKAVFTPHITINDHGSDPQHVSVTATITTELK